jgi:hypothetical protein
MASFYQTLTSLLFLYHPLQKRRLSRRVNSTFSDHAQTHLLWAFVAWERSARPAARRSTDNYNILF